MSTPLSWNATLLSRTGNTSTVRYHGAWKYYGWDHNWYPIVNEFREDSGKWISDQSPWSVLCPRYADERMVVVNEDRYDPHSRQWFTPISDPIVELDHPYASHVEGMVDPQRPGRIIYPHALGLNVHLAAGKWPCRKPRAEHLVIIDALPNGDGDAVVVERVFTPLSLIGLDGSRWDGSTVDIGLTGAVLLTPTGDVGVRMLPAKAWWYDSGQLVTIPISVLATRYQGYTEIRKIFPRWAIVAALAAGSSLMGDETTATFKPDAHPETTTVDGYVGRTTSSETYSAIRTGSGVYADDSTATAYWHLLQTNLTTNNRFRDLGRGIALFDTTSLTAGDTITDVKLRLYTLNVITQGSSWTSRVVTSTPSSNTSISNTDYSQVSTTVVDLGGLASGSLSANTWCEFNLATTSVTKGGITKLGGRSAGDVNGSAEFSVKGLFNGHQIATADSVNDPELVVTYTGSGGNIELTTPNASCTASSITPSYSLGPLTLSQSDLSSQASSQPPSITLGTLIISCDAISGAASSNAQQIQLGALSVTVETTSSAGSCQAPSYSLGAVVVENSIASSSCVAVAGSFILSALTITPPQAQASAAAFAVNIYRLYPVQWADGGITLLTTISSENSGVVQSFSSVSIFVLASFGEINSQR